MKPYEYSHNVTEVFQNTTNPRKAFSSKPCLGMRMTILGNKGNESKLTAPIPCPTNSHVEPQSQILPIIIANELTEGSMHIYQLGGKSLLKVVFGGFFYSPKLISTGKQN